jgi:T5orf172 domain
MNPGYIYIFQNKSFDSNLVKIGRTSRKPDVRVKELYRGASGVPEPFHVTFACQVSDCILAEKEIHNILKTYRRNKSREFFFILVASAKALILDVCQNINKCLNHPTENLAVIDEQLNFNADDEAPDPSGSFSINLDCLILSPPGVSSLSSEQKLRIRIIAETLKEVHPQTYEEWIEGFTRDIKPEREIQIWEQISKAFLKVDRSGNFDKEQRREAFQLLLQRSAESTNSILKDLNLETLSRSAANIILRGYEVPPEPVLINRKI